MENSCQEKIKTEMSNDMLFLSLLFGLSLSCDLDDLAEYTRKQYGLITKFKKSAVYLFSFLSDLFLYNIILNKYVIFGDGRLKSAILKFDFINCK